MHAISIILSSSIKVLIFLIFVLIFDPKTVSAQTTNCGRGVLGRVQVRSTQKYVQPENDDGVEISLCSNSIYAKGAEANGTLIIANRAGGNSDWNCNPGAAYDRKVPGSDCGAGPHKFTFNPPTGYTCSDVSWWIDYASCSYGCTDYVPPTNAQTRGSGCEAVVYLGPGLYDNHLWWILDKAPTPTPVPPVETPPPPQPLIPGDANDDRWVNGNDFSIWAYHFHPFNKVLGGISVGDFNQDGYVNANDFSIWQQYFNPYEPY